MALEALTKGAAEDGSVLDTANVSAAAKAPTAVLQSDEFQTLFGQLKEATAVERLALAMESPYPNLHRAAAFGTASQSDKAARLVADSVAARAL